MGAGAQRTSFGAVTVPEMGCTGNAAICVGHDDMSRTGFSGGPYLDEDGYVYAVNQGRAGLYLDTPVGDFAQSSVGIPMGAILDVSPTLQSVAESQAPSVALWTADFPFEHVLAVAPIPWSVQSGPGLPPLPGAGWTVSYLGRVRLPVTTADGRPRVMHLGSVMPYWPDVVAPFGVPSSTRVPPGRPLTLSSGLPVSDIRHADILSSTGGSGSSVADPVWTTTWETRSPRGSRLHVLYLRDPDDERAGGGNIGHAYSDDAGRTWSRLRVPVGPDAGGVPPVLVSLPGRVVEVLDPASGERVFEALPRSAASVRNTKVLASYFMPGPQAMHLYYPTWGGGIVHLWKVPGSPWRWEAVIDVVEVQAVSAWWSESYERHNVAFVDRAGHLWAARRRRGAWETQRLTRPGRRHQGALADDERHVTLGLASADSGEGGDVYWHRTDGLIRVFEANDGAFREVGREEGVILQDVTDAPLVRDGRMVAWRAPRWQGGNRGRQHLFCTDDGGDLLHMWWLDARWHAQTLSLRRARHIREDVPDSRARSRTFPVFASWPRPATPPGSSRPSGSFLYVARWNNAVWEAVPADPDEHFAQGRLHGGLRARSVSGTAGCPSGFAYRPLDPSPGGTPARP